MLKSDYIELDLSPLKVARALLYPASAFILFQIFSFILELGISKSEYFGVSVIILFYTISLFPITWFKRKALLWTLIILSVLAGERLILLSIGSFGYGINQESLFFTLSIAVYAIFLLLVIRSNQTIRGNG